VALIDSPPTSFVAGTRVVASRRSCMTNSGHSGIVATSERSDVSLRDGAQQHRRRQSAAYCLVRKCCAGCSCAAGPSSTMRNACFSRIRPELVLMDVHLPRIDGLEADGALESLAPGAVGASLLRMHRGRPALVRCEDASRGNGERRCL
jgi:hypothetical protein